METKKKWNFSAKWNFLYSKKCLLEMMKKNYKNEKIYFLSSNLENVSEYWYDAPPKNSSVQQPPPGCGKLLFKKSKECELIKVTWSEKTFLEPWNPRSKSPRLVKILKEKRKKLFWTFHIQIWFKTIEADERTCENILQKRDFFFLMI